MLSWGRFPAVPHWSSVRTRGSKLEATKLGVAFVSRVPVDEELINECSLRPSDTLPVAFGFCLPSAFGFGPGIVGFKILLVLWIQDLTGD